MNRNLLLALLIAAQPASPMPRNPFQPLLAPCAALVKKLAQWTLHGVISSEKGAIVIMRDPQKKWRRLTRGMQTERGTQILEIDQRLLSVTLPAECGRPFYSWKTEGKTYGMDASVRSANSLAVSRPRE